MKDIIQHNPVANGWVMQDLNNKEYVVIDQGYDMTFKTYSFRLKDIKTGLERIVPAEKIDENYFWTGDFPIYEKISDNKSIMEEELKNKKNMDPVSNHWIIRDLLGEEYVVMDQKTLERPNGLQFKMLIVPFNDKHKGTWIYIDSIRDEVLYHDNFPAYIRVNKPIESREGGLLTTKESCDNVIRQLKKLEIVANMFAEEKNKNDDIKGPEIRIKNIVEKNGVQYVEFDIDDYRKALEPKMEKEKKKSACGCERPCMCDVPDPVKERWIVKDNYSIIYFITGMAGADNGMVEYHLYPLDRKGKQCSVLIDKVKMGVMYFKGMNILEKIGNYDDNAMLKFSGIDKDKDKDSEEYIVGQNNNKLYSDAEIENGVFSKEDIPCNTASWINFNVDRNNLSMLKVGCRINDGKDHYDIVKRVSTKNDGIMYVTVRASDGRPASIFAKDVCFKTDVNRANGIEMYVWHVVALNLV